MMRLFGYFLWIGLLSASTYSQSVIGQWVSLDDNNHEECIIQLYMKNNKLHGKVIELLQEEDRGKICSKCPGKKKDQPLLGLEILSGFEEEDGLWTGGRILVPKTGKAYRCNISIDENGQLIIRGYVGISLLGKSTYWQRVESE